MERKPPPKITPAYLENAGLHYLERFSSSSANLRRVLMRKIDRSLAHWGGERDEATRWLDDLLIKLAESGYIDDAAYAVMKTRGLHHRGKGMRVIRATLTAKGIGAETAQTALDGLVEEEGDPDFAAAIRLAAKRRLGPYRLGHNRAEMRQKDLAALARAGFGFETARRVIEAASAEALEEELGHGNEGITHPR